MQHSLLHRFQGTLVGSIIRPTPPLKPIYELSQDLGERLIGSEGLKAADGLELRQKYEEQLPFPLSSSQFILATLPLQLRYYDAPCQGQVQLASLGKIWEQPQSTLADIMVWGHSLTLALQEKLNPRTLVSQLLGAYPGLDTPLMLSLRELPRWLNHRLPLAAILSHFPHHPNLPVLAALSCFMTTPEDAKLCLLRASHSPLEPGLTSALTGALSGSYNSVVGLPLSWRWTREAEGLIASRTEQAQLLFARWSGVYEIKAHPSLACQALASAGTIQRRENLKIISQRAV